MSDQRDLMEGLLTSFTVRTQDDARPSAQDVLAFSLNEGWGTEPWEQCKQAVWQRRAEATLIDLAAEGYAVIPVDADSLERAAAAMWDTPWDLGPGQGLKYFRRGLAALGVEQP